MGLCLAQSVQSGRRIIPTDCGCAHCATRQPRAAPAHEQHAAGVGVAQQRVRRPRQLLSEDSAQLVTRGAHSAQVAGLSRPIPPPSAFPDRARSHDEGSMPALLRIPHLLGSLRQAGREREQLRGLGPPGSAPRRAAAPGRRLAQARLQRRRRARHRRQQRAQGLCAALRRAEKVSTRCSQAMQRLRHWRRARQCRPSSRASAGLLCFFPQALH